jgi:hypothetical protein
MRYRKEVREAIEEAKALGFEIIETGGSGKGARHVKMRHTGNGGMIVFPATPSSPSWRKNQRADAKRVARDGSRKKYGQ